jgi:hypothetical protein
MDEVFDIDIGDTTGFGAAAHVCTCNPLKVKEYSSTRTPDNCAFTRQHVEHANKQVSSSVFTPIISTWVHCTYTIRE